MNKYLHFAIPCIFIMCGCTTSPQVSTVQVNEERKSQETITPIPKKKKQLRKKTSTVNSRYYRYKLKQRCTKKSGQTEEQINACLKKLMDSN